MNRTEITLQDIFWAIKKYIVWILLACLLGALLSYAYTAFFVTPKYAAEVTLVTFAAEREGNDVSYNEQLANSSLSYTYAALMNSEPVTSGISELLGGKVSSGAVKAMLQAERLPSTQVIRVTITHSDPQLAVEVGNALLDVAPSTLPEKAGGTLHPVNTAKAASQVSPNMTSNVITGLLIGLLLSCGIVVLIAMTDTTIWREEDLERAYNIPVLGSVPSMLSNKDGYKKGG